MLDVKIEGATVVDGTGTAGGRTGVGIDGDAIVALGDLSREPAFVIRHGEHTGSLPGTLVPNL